MTRLLRVTATALLVCSTAAVAQEASPLDRAEAALTAGDLDAARTALGEAAPVDSLEVEALLGLIDLRAGDARSASTRFSRVLALRPNRLGVWVYLGQARYVLGDYEGALEALVEGQAAGARQPGYFLLRSRTERQLDDGASAWTTLITGRERFPTADELLREQSFFLLELGLVVEARRLASAYRDGSPEDVYGWQLVAEVERRAGDLEAAAAVIEAARLRHPSADELTLQLAHLYAELGMHGPAARLFAGAARTEADAVLAAADQYRLAGRPFDALRWNALVDDDVKRAKQRIAIHVAAGSNDRALALGETGPLDSEMRLLLAHAAVRVGRFGEAIDFIDGIDDAAVRDRANALRRVAEECDDPEIDCTGLLN